MHVRDIMQREVVTATPTTPYEVVVKLMHERGFSGMPVVEADGKLVGIVSEKDLFRALYPEASDYVENGEFHNNADIEKIRRQPIADFMQTNIKTVEPDMSALKAGGMMLAYGIHRLPVIEENTLIGLVTRKEVYIAILKDRLGF